MTDAATPGTEEQKPPTPATPAEPSGEETVTLPKKEHERLQRDAARAAAAQREADTLKRVYRGGEKSHFSQPTPKPEPSQEEREEQAQAEDRKASVGLQRLAMNPQYREVLDADPTLRQLFIDNPLAVLPILADDALDAQDAIERVKEELDKRLTSRKPAAPDNKGESPNQKPSTDSPAPNPNPGSSAQVDEEYEAARKNPNTEDAVVGMIKVGMKKMGTGKGR